MVKRFLTLKLLLFSLVLLISTAMNAQHKVTGTVTDENGDPLIGVNVVEKGTTIGTVTDTDGIYSITASGPNVTLIFSYVGFLKEEASINGRQQINMTLLPDITELEAIVVVGYGTQRKVDVTGAVASVEAGDIEKIPAASINQVLQGRLSGVSVTQNSGAPGGDISVRIRGLGSVNNNDPLYVIDGFPTKGGMSTLNPNDIASIDVLKDASATAIYGARGANGVIIITTKRGKKGKAEFTFDSYYGVQTLEKSYEMLNSVDYAEYVNEIIYNAALQNEVDYNPYYFYDANGDGRYQAAEDTVPISQWLRKDSADVDWLDIVTQPAIIQSYQLSALGGGDKSRYSLSGGYFDQQGVIRGSNFKRLNFRANTDNDITEWLTVGNSFTFANLSRDRVIEQGPGRTVIGRALRMMPTFEPYYDDGETFRITRSNPASIRNPLRWAIGVDDYTKNTSTIGNVYADIKIFPGLSFRVNAGLSYYFSQGYYYEPTYGVPQDNWNNLDADSRRSYVRSTNWLIENLLTYSKEFGDKHNITLLAGYTAQEDRSDFLVGEVEGFAHPSQKELSAGKEWKNLQSSVNEWSLLSQLARVNYSYDDKYLLTASIRRDGSSRFGRDNLYGVFPSFSFGWRLSQEDFIRNISYISNLKLRAGFGKTGNQEIGNYGAYSRLRPIGWVAGDQLLLNAGYAPNEPLNEELRWEGTTMTNLGLDFAMFQNQLQATFEFYQRGTDGMLIRKPIPWSTGYTTDPFVNVGEIKNTGFEGNISFKKNLGQFSFTTGMNFSFNKNEVISLGEGSPPLFGGNMVSDGGPFTTKTEVGHPIGSFYGFVSDGIFQTYEEVLNSPFQSHGTRAGDIKFKDLNGDGEVTEEDKTYIGSPWPDFIYGFNLGASYKNFNLSLFFQGVQGNDILFWDKRYYEGMGGFSNQNVAIKDRWREPVIDQNTGEVIDPGNTNTDMPRAIYGDPNGNNRVSDRLLEDGSYLRLKNAIISYDLPESLISRLRIGKAQIYVSGNNLFTFTNYSGLDPDVGEIDLNDQENGGDATSAGIDRGGYPVARNYLMGLRLTF